MKRGQLLSLVLVAGSVGLLLVLVVVAAQTDHQVSALLQGAGLVAGLVCLAVLAVYGYVKISRVPSVE